MLVLNCEFELCREEIRISTNLLLLLVSFDRNEILEAEGVVPDYSDGIRITDAKTLQIARVSLSLYSHFEIAFF